MLEEVKRENGKDDRVCDISMALRPPPATDEGLQMKAQAVPGRSVGPTRRSTKGGWTVEEDQILVRAVKQFMGKNWKKIAEYIPSRTDVQCLHRWQKVLNPNLIKGAWTKEEDDRIVELVAKYGPKKWSLIAESMPGRIGKQCRERWHNHLNPAIKKDPWTKEEELILVRAHQAYGNRWAEIAKFLPGRADNSIKNHWNCSLKKRLDSILASGIINQSPGLAAFDLNDHGQGVSRPQLDPATQKFTLSLEQKQTEDQPSSTSHACLLHNNASLAGKDLGLQPFLVDKAARTRAAGDSECATVEICDFFNPSARWGDTSPETASGLSFEDCNHHHSNDLLHQTTNSPSIGDSACRKASDDSHYGSFLQPRVSNTVGNQFFPVFQFNGSFSDIPLEHPRGAQGHEFDKSYSAKLMENNITSSPAAQAHSDENICDCTQLEAPEGPPLSLQTTNTKDHHVMQDYHSTQYSTPPNLSLTLACLPNSPQSILRSRAKNYKNTPSIIRKRGRESSKKLFAEDFHSAKTVRTQDIMDSDHISKKLFAENFHSAKTVRTQDIMDSDHTPVRDSIERKEQFDLSSVVVNGKQFVLFLPEHLQASRVSDSMKYLEKNLGAEFDMEWDASSLRRFCSFL